MNPNLLLEFETGKALPRTFRYGSRHAVEP